MRLRHPARIRRGVFQALTDARAAHGGGAVALVDGDERTFTYDEIIRASFALGSALKRGTRRGRVPAIRPPPPPPPPFSSSAAKATGYVPCPARGPADG